MGDTFEDDKFYETFTKIDRKQTPKDIEFLLQGLSKHFIFSQLVNDKLLLEDVLRKFFFCQVEKGQYIIKQNDDASSFFVLETGKLSVIING
jgi:cGMP-dependent protein kinase